MLVFEAYIGFVLGFNEKIHWHMYFFVKKNASHEGLKYIIIFIKFEKNAIEIQSSASEEFFPLVFNCTNFTMKILMKMGNTIMQLVSTSF